MCSVTCVGCISGLTRLPVTVIHRYIIRYIAVLSRQRLQIDQFMSISDKSRIKFEALLAAKGQ